MNNDKTSWLQRPIHPSMPAITNEIALFAGIILLAIITRFHDLGTRVMSHDESLHTYFSWLLYRGQGYQHTPMMHGPFQFHIIALTYFLFGVSDFTARIPSVLFSIATIWMVWYWRRYLGNWGVLIAGFLMVVSPYMLYYGRYVRNESFVGFSGILLLYAILRYRENGEKKYLYMVTAATLLHFTSKETAFIYTAQALFFLGILFLYRVTKAPWENQAQTYRTFIILLAISAVLVAIGLSAILYTHSGAGTLSIGETAAPANPTGESLSPGGAGSGAFSLPNILLELGILGAAAAGFIYFRLAYIKRVLPKERSFDLLVLILTFVLPLLTAFILDSLKKVGLSDVTIPTDAASVLQLSTYTMTIMGIILTVLFAITILIGQVWNREWWKFGVFYWGVFTILYTTIFTNAAGFFTGIVGSLGYWLVQQGVERGSQPEYYYILVQIPLYEFLPALGSLVAIGLGLKKISGKGSAVPAAEAEVSDGNEANGAKSEPAGDNFAGMFSLLVYWVITSILAFSIAGERMPWLTYHMAWPMVLLSGWGIGQMIEGAIERTKGESPWRMALAVLVLGVFMIALFNTIKAAFVGTPPFQGTELAQLEATSSFLFPLITTILAGILITRLMQKDLVSLGIVLLIALAVITTGSGIINGAMLLNLPASDPAGGATNGMSETVRFAAALLALVASIAGINYLLRNPRTSSLVNLAALTVISLLAIQTGRTAFRANYINYDNATEYLVYAHAATGVKEVMSQVEEISRRTAGGLNAVIAYDASAPDTGVSWPFVWYLRDFTALRSFDQPTRSLREAVAVIVDQKNFDKINAALGNEFYEFDYIRMWWPNQDYFNLDRSRVLNALTNPDIREGIYDIWFNRDYTKYAQAVGSASMTLTSWQPSDQMKLFVRKDIASQIWNYGVGPSEAPAVSDPYKTGTILLAADQIFGPDRYPSGLNAPRSIAAGLNADFYIADSRNHRILHIASDGSLLHQWGSFADAFAGQAPIGTFNEPWGVAVGPDGSVYISDTWNHRIQKFTEDGRPLKMWGQYGQPQLDIPESASLFWGPRGIAIDSFGHVLVADTGNKRIVVFDKDGNYITEFGTAGFDPGQFDEPVGVAVAPSGTVYVTDTWNQRVQAFIPNQDGTFYFPSLQWDVNAWFGQSLDNKPFIAVGANEHVFITDPEGFRVIEFTPNGEFVRTWGDFGSGPEGIGLAAGIAVDQPGFVWVTDAGNNRILRYSLP
jgi:uncharacterized protein (TIGR03663 family)